MITVVFTVSELEELLSKALYLADALKLDLVAIRISEAIDQLKRDSVED
jgi:hypothetical protein